MIKAVETTRSTLLILALAALATGMVIVLGLHLDRATEEEIVTSFSQRQLLLAEQTAAGIQFIFDEARRDLLHIGGGGGLACLTAALAAENEEKIATCRGVTEQGFSSYLHSHPIYAQIRYIDTEGQEIAGANRDGETVRVISQEQLRSQAERDFFVATMPLDAGEVYVSPLEPALGHGGVGAGLLTVRLATPVFDSQGRPAGIVVIDLLGDEIRARIARLSAEEKVDAWVLDGTGVEIINVTYPEWEGSNAYEYCQQTGDETLVALAEDMLAGGRGTGIHLWPESEGGPPVVKKLRAYVPVYPVEDHVWSLSTSVTYDSILAAHRQTRTILLLLGGSVIAVILVTVLLVVRSSYKRAVAEEQARHGESLRRRNEELAALREISLAISAQLELDVLLQDIVEQGCRLLDVKASSLYLVDETRGDLELVVSHGYTRDYTGTRMAPGEGVSGRVLQSGKPLVVDDYHHWEGRSPDWEDEPITAVLGVPLKRGEQVVGSLAFEEIAQPRSFDERDLRLAALFAGQAAIAIENARLYQAARAARERADTLREISRVVGSTLELDQVLSIVLRQAKRVLAYDSASILLFADDQPAMAAVAGFEDDDLVKSAVSLRLGDSPILQAMARDHLPIVIADVREDERWIWAPGTEQVRAWIGAPLLVRDEMVGALMIDSTRPGLYTTADGAIAQTLANQVAVAIENARLYEQAQRRLESLTNFNLASQVITSSLDVKVVLEQIVKLIGSVVNSDYTSVILLDEEGQPVLGVEDLRGLPPIEQRIRSGGVTRHVLDSGQPVVVDAIADDGAMTPPLHRPDGELVRANPSLVAAGTRSFAAAPIQAKEKTVGVLFVHGRQSRAFHGQLPLLITFANQAAVAIENARLYEQAKKEIVERKRVEEEIRRRTTQLEALREAALELTAELDLDDLLQSIVSRAIELLEGSAGGLYLYRPERDVLEWTGSSSVVPSGSILHRGDGLAGQVWESGAPVVVHDYRRWEGRATIYEGLPIEGVVGVPVHWAKEFLAVLTVEANHPRAFSPDDTKLLSLFATQAAIAMRNAHLHEETHSRAERLAAVNRVARAAGSTLRLDDLLETVYQEVASVFQLDAFFIALYDEGAGDLDLRLLVDEGVREPPRRQPLGSGWASMVITEEEPLLIRDVEQERERVPSPSLFGTMKHAVSWLGVPMWIGERVVGVISVQAYHSHAYGEEEQLLLSTIADQVAVAVENARLYEAERKRAAQLAVVNQVARKAAAILNPGQLLQESVTAIQQGFGYHNVILLQLDQATGALGNQAISGGLADIAPLDYRQKVGEGLIGWTAETGRSLLVNDVSQDPHYILGFQEKVTTRAELCVPLKLGDQVIGVLDVQEIRLNAFDEMDLVAMETLADQIAVAIENSRLYEQAQQEIAERKQAEESLQEANAGLEALYHVGQMLNSTLEIDAILDRLTDEAMRVTRATHGQVLVVRKESGRFEQCSLRGFSPPEAELARTVPLLLDRGINGRAYTTRQTIRVDDVRDEPGYFPLIPATRTELAVPITREGEVMGNLDLQSPEVGAFRDADLDYLNALADQAAVAIENARLFEAEREQRQLAEALEEAAAAVSSTLDPDQVLDRILEQVERVVAGDTFNVMLVEDDQARVVRRLGYESLGAGGQSAAFSCPIARYPNLMEMMRTGEPVVVPNTMADTDWVQEENRSWLRSYVAAPIKAGGVTVGFLNVNGTRPGQFDATDARRLQAFAGHVATAIENARLHGKLREHADTLEQRVEERTAQLQAQYAQSEAILQSATDGIVVTDAEGEIIRVNPVAQIWLTRTLSPEDSSRLQETVRELAQRAETQPKAVLELTGLDLELKAAPIAEPGIAAAAAVVAVYDVSHLKALERMKSQFVSNVSHELRTPVTVIKLYAHLMQRQPEKWQEHLGTLAHEADRQARLIEDILRISRIDAGRMEMKPQPASLDELINLTIANYQILAQEQGLTLKHRLVEPGSVVLVDSRRMTQVLGNLMENAIRYTPQGGAVVISTGQEETDGRTWATATVTDTGMGVPEDELPHIFERFFRGEEPSLMQISGTGLGLAIVKEIVELHGGRVTVESQLGKGSVFTVWLPLAG